MVNAPPRGQHEVVPPFRDGEIIAGKYEMDRVLGQGGMGVVVAAHHVALRQKVAIKLLLPAAMEIPGAAQRFLREARSAVAIHSEHVARVLDVGQLEDGTPFLVMEYLTGSDLGNVLRRSGPLPIAVAIDYMLQACEAIAEAHAIGIVHRDLKPDNVFLTQRADGSSLIKVLDFGLSKPTKEDGLGPSMASITGSNLVAGSPQYMSPEQVRSLKNVDHRTDVWALGVILYELVVGRRPFDAQSAAGVFAKIAADAPVPPRALRPEIPPLLEAAILRCLEKDVTRRMQSVAELAQSLSPVAPAEARTSIERILRLGAVPGAPGAQAAPPGLGAADSMEAEIPTFAVAPAPIATVPSAGAGAAPPPQPRHVPVQVLSAPPVAVKRPPAAIDMPEMELDLRAPPAAERGRRSPVPKEKEAETGVKLSDLEIAGPIRVLLVAIGIAVADMVAARLLGHPLMIGPVRPLWLAGPLAGAGALWLVWKITNR